LLRTNCYNPTIDSIPEDSTVFLKNDYQDLYRQNFDLASMGVPGINHSLTAAAPIQLSNPFMSGMFCKMEYKLESKSKISPPLSTGLAGIIQIGWGVKKKFIRDIGSDR
jgi:hypothetical protein